MSTNYPAAKDTTGASGSLPVEPSGTPLVTSHIAAHQNESDAIIALETKVGIDSSPDTSTIDYKLKSISSIDPGHKHNLGVSLADVLITSPADGNGLVYNGAAGKWENSTVSVADASTTVKGVTKMSVAPVSPTSPIAVGQNDPVFTTLSGTGTGSSNKIVDSSSLGTTATNNAVVRANSSGVIDKTFLTLINKFGGTGTDGALNVTSGTTTIALGSAATVVKNYTSINVSVGATLAFSGPASAGTTIILKSQGNVTIAGTVDLTGMGNQNPGSGGSVAGAGGTGAAGGNILDALTTHGGGGSVNTGTPGVAGIIYQFFTFFHTQVWKTMFLAPGSSGGGGSGGTNGTGTAGVGSAGGKGAGSLFIECAGTYTATGTITAAGSNGTAGVNQSGGGNGGGGGGGGGGGAGDIYVVANAIGTDTATYTVTGGLGGVGGSGNNTNGGQGGAGGGGGANSDNAGVIGGGGGGGGGGTGGAGAAGVAIRELNTTWA